MQAETRVTMNVDVPRGAQQQLRDYCAAHGLIQRHLMGSLIAKFLAAPDALKRVLRGDVDPAMRGVYADALDHLARELRGPEPTTPFLDVSPGSQSRPEPAPGKSRNGRKRSSSL